MPLLNRFLWILLQRQIGPWKKTQASFVTKIKVGAGERVLQVKNLYKTDFHARSCGQKSTQRLRYRQLLSLRMNIIAHEVDLQFQRISAESAKASFNQSFVCAVWLLPVRVIDQIMVCFREAVNRRPCRLNRAAPVAHYAALLSIRLF